MRRGLALVAVMTLAVPGGMLAPIPASGAGARTTSTSSGTVSATATGAPTPTVGGNNGLSGFPTPPVATSSTTPTVVNPSTGGRAGASGFSGTSALIIVLGAVVILGGISYFIWHDARRRAPVRETTGVPGTEGRSKPGSKPAPRPRKLSPAERRRRKRGRARGSRRSR